MSLTHSKLSPSSANIWVPCPGSIMLCDGLPDEETEAAREGTIAHEQAASALTGQTQVADEHVQFYLDYVREKIVNGGRLHVEQTISIKTIHNECFGTPDAFATFGLDTVHVFDFKYGRGQVLAFKNWQLICYACGIHEMYPDLRNFTLHIVQPRVFGEKIRAWTVSIEQLRPYFEELREAAKSAMTRFASCNPGTWCRYCKGRGECMALRDQTAKILDTSYLPTTYELNNVNLGNELRVLKRDAKLIEYRIAALEEQALKSIDNGYPVPGFATKPSAGRLKWDKPVEDIKALGEMFGVSLGKDTTVTPAQAIKAGVPQNVVKQYASRPSSGMKLVEVDGSQVFNGGN